MTLELHLYEWKKIAMRRPLMTRISRRHSNRIACFEELIAIYGPEAEFVYFEMKPVMDRYE